MTAIKITENANDSKNYDNIYKNSNPCDSKNVEILINNNNNNNSELESVKDTRSSKSEQTASVNLENELKALKASNFELVNRINDLIKKVTILEAAIQNNIRTTVQQNDLSKPEIEGKEYSSKPIGKGSYINNKTQIASTDRHNQINTFITRPKPLDDSYARIQRSRYNNYQNNYSNGYEFNYKNRHNNTTNYRQYHSNSFLNSTTSRGNEYHPQQHQYRSNFE